MTVQQSLDKMYRDAEQIGSWADYAVYMMGDVDSGDENLDAAISELYEANERVHRLANQLALRYEVDFMEGKTPT